MLSRLPRHDRAPVYVRSGLFRNLSNFVDLEQRIEQLPTEKERGDAFEVFVEAYLTLDEMAQAEAVWVGRKVPTDIRRRLNLPRSDYGYDGVYRTRLGELVAYQVKFRTGRAPLPYADLATFFGISEKADRRLVLTNSIAISAVAESRTGFQTTRGGDFDRLSAAELGAISAWIEGAKPAAIVREPRPHQRAALADIERELSERDRTTVVMACGTGKTLVALWVAEQAKPKRVLVLVPSLSLLRQTLHEWARWTNWGDRFRYLAVCSDPKVAKGLDEIEIRPEDADFPVRTDLEVVRRFLDNGGGAVSVVFCTYQSAKVVGAAMRRRDPFDIGIFDEAHKTTGREGTPFAFALQDKNLPIRKRLFMTATPRHYDIRKRDKEGDFAVASMDDETVYGRVAHHLTFSAAAAQNIIVPYKVVISVVDSEMIDNALLDKSEVVVKGDPVKAKWVAHQIALKRAVEEHDLQRVITFHSSIKAAAAFASNDSEGIGSHLPQFQRFHVSSEQATAERDERMRGFSSAQRGIITNARCLTEGVDVPSVDMVAFMNPRRSRVDIVQAVGRAMRTAADKTCGYVLVPLLLEMRKDESLDEALERSDFDEVAQVLNAMRDNDDNLRDIIEMLMVERGRTGGFDESRLRDKIEVLGPQLQLSELAASIRARLVEELGVSWDERYGQLVAYKETHGDCDVPARWDDNPGLGRWCSNQRTNFRTKSLSHERVKRLEEIGFEWDMQEVSWERMLSALATYKKENGNCNVPNKWKENPELANWCDVQRACFRTMKLASDRFKRLDDIGFVWNPQKDAWEKNFAELLEYKAAHGDCNVPVTGTTYPTLGSWCHVQRGLFVAGRLSRERIDRLNGIEFVWDARDASWEVNFEALVAYKKSFGHCNVPRGWEQPPQLDIWCANQRQFYRKNRLSASRISRLERIGFLWNVLDAQWEEMFRELVAYKQAHGDCNVPDDMPKLGTWCGIQRARFNRGNLSEARIKRLEDQGFVWVPYDSQWQRMFSALVAYKEEHGNCNVPQGWKPNPELGGWCSVQRQQYKRKKLKANRIQQLNAIGFMWDPHETIWEDNFFALCAYNAAHGDCNIPAHWDEKPGLRGWCSVQRTNFKARKLSSERIRRLEEIGFVWNALDAMWDEMFAALAAYKQTHGDCNVPQAWHDNPRLGKWCAKQRIVYRKNKLAADRMKRLEDIGFQFSPKKSQSETIPSRN